MKEQNVITIDRLMWQIVEEKMSWNEAIKYVEKLNLDKYAGYNDWRLPTIKELENVVKVWGGINGFLFTPTYDILFDKGYISFKNDKSLIISASLDKNTIKALNLIENDRIKLLPIENRELYLEYHRDIILKKVG